MCSVIGHKRYRFPVMRVGKWKSDLTETALSSLITR